MTGISKPDAAAEFYRRAGFTVGALRGSSAQRRAGRLAAPPDMAHGATLIFEAAK